MEQQCRYLDAPAKMVIVKIEQPPEGYGFTGFVWGDKPHFSGKTVIDGVEYDTGCWKFLPLPLGVKVGVRKPWKTYYTQDAYGNNVEMLNDGETQETAFTWLTVSSIAVKQVKELTAKECGEDFELCDRLAQDELLKKHPDWTDKTYVEVAGLTEVL